MGIGCKDKCRFEKNGGKYKYLNGRKYCSICDKSLYGAVRCYCCHHVLRVGVQNNDGRSRRIADCARIE